MSEAVYRWAGTLTVLQACAHCAGATPILIPSDEREQPQCISCGYDVPRVNLNLALARQHPSQRRYSNE